MTFDPVRLGVAGLGRAFVLMLPSLRADPRVRVVAAAAPRAESRAAFETEFGGRAYDSVEALCADPDVDAIYVATPHQMHAEHAVSAARAGKHLLIDKPISIALDDARRMVMAAQDAGVHLIVGPSHSFDAPVSLARAIIDSGEFGRLRMIQALNYTDFLYRPRRPEELRTQDGGGVIFSQAVHQVDIVRLLAGGLATNVSAMTGAWDPDRPSEGAYAALLGFETGVFATLTYSGYAHFDSDIWMGDVGELGQQKQADDYGKARRALRATAPQDEIAAKRRRTFGADAPPPDARHQEHFGPVIALCDRADLRLTPDGVEIFGDDAREFRATPIGPVPRQTVLDALVAAVRQDRAPVQSGAWGLASLEVCHAILAAARTGQPQGLIHQVAT